jgi:prophage antirepressor-like protein
MKMEDYMLVKGSGAGFGTNPPGGAQSSPQPFDDGSIWSVCFREFFGAMVRIAFRNQLSAMYVEDAINALGRDNFGTKLSALFSRYGHEILVEENGAVRCIRVATETEVYNLVFQCDSQRADEFREFAGRVLEEVRRTGFYIAKPAPAQTSSSLSTAAIRAICDQMDVMNAEIVIARSESMAARCESSAAIAEIAVVRAESVKATQTANQAMKIARNDDDFYTLSHYVNNLKRKHISTKETIDWGYWLWRELKRLGRLGAIHPTKVYNPQDKDEFGNLLPGARAANRYHVSVLDGILWPKLCQQKRWT